jgi:hypothetical protein
MSTVVLSSSGSQCLYFSANDHPIPAAISPCSFPLPSLPLPLFLSFSLFSCDHPTCLSLEARLTVPSPPLLAGGRTIFVTWSTLDLILHTVGGRVLNRVDISLVRVHVLCSHTCSSIQYIAHDMFSKTHLVTSFTRTAERRKTVQFNEVRKLRIVRQMQTEITPARSKRPAAQLAPLHESTLLPPSPPSTSPSSHFVIASPYFSHV